MNLDAILGRETLQALVDVEIEKTQESFHVFAIPHDFEVREGDAVLLHGVPTEFDMGTMMTLQCAATVSRANMLQRAWTRISALFELTELYEVGFQPKDDIEAGFVPHRRQGVLTL
jgi:hypothetical protein